MKNQLTIDLPAWATCCAEPHATEVDMLRAHLDHAQREIIQLRDRASIAARNEDQRDRAMRSAAKRDAWQHTLRSVQLYVMGEAKDPFWRLACLTEEVDTHVARGQAHTGWAHMLKWAARDLKEALEQTKDPDAANGGLIAEVRRLRDAIDVQGQWLHAEYAFNDGKRCGCPGCELIRSIEVHEVAA